RRAPGSQAYAQLRGEGRALFKPAQTIRITKLYHRQVYEYAYHEPKLAFLRDSSNGQLNPARASRFKVSRTVDGATPTSRAISLSPTPSVDKLSTSRTWRIVVLSAVILSPVQKPK